ncbi:MAG: hypothetical protein JEZ07_09470 [Phycisphaerae bacterium]|nr:hypothetical protein [Phycisphaerae bacterium]
MKFFNKCIKFILLIWTIFIISGATCLGQYSGGTGTEADPYQIATAEDLIRLGNTTEDYNSCFIMTADIDLACYEFTQAVIAPDDSTESGLQGSKFTGSFNGNNHTISNLTIDGSGNDCVGLFGMLYEAQVSHLNLKNVDIHGSKETGGLVGILYYSQIESISVSGHIEGDTYVGGLAGSSFALTYISEGPGTIATINTCRADVNVSGINYVGGLVGDNRSYIVSSFTNGVVNAQESFAGGIVGRNLYSTIRNCYAKASVNGSQHVGGLAGVNGGHFEKCYTTGDISGDNSVGGMVGALSSFPYGDNPTLTACFWDIQTGGVAQGVGNIAGSISYGKTTAEMQTLSTFTDAGWDFVGETDNGIKNIWLLPDGDYPQLRNITYSGGVGSSADPYQISTARDMIDLGYSVKDYDKCFIMTSDIDMGDYDFDKALIAPGFYEDYEFEGEKFTGSFDGDGHIIHNLTINAPQDNCVALFGSIGNGAEVKKLGLINANITGGNIVAGMVGYIYESTCNIDTVNRVNNCFVTGKITGTYVVGGLLGSINYCAIIEHNYSTARIIAENYAGGLIATNSSSQSAAGFWDSQTSQCDDSDGGIDKTTEQMHQKATFTDADWDFENIWAINDGFSYPYFIASQPKFKLDIEVKGSGSVLFEPAPVNGCYVPGTVITLTADDTGTFGMKGWQGVHLADGLVATVIMDSDKTILADFWITIEIDSLESLAKIGNDPNYPLDEHYILTANIDAWQTANWNDEESDEEILEGFEPMLTGTLKISGLSMMDLAIHIS